MFKRLFAWLFSEPEPGPVVVVGEAGYERFLAMGYRFTNRPVPLWVVAPWETRDQYRVMVR